MSVIYVIVPAVLIVAWLSGRAVRALGQPAVVGELVAGIALGPSVFGAIAPRLSDEIFTPDITSAIALIARVAVIVFMFLVGLELDLGILKRHATGVLRIAAFNLILPFAIGSLLAVWLYPDLHGTAANHLGFVLFVGTALSITALPVLTRILTDLRLLSTTVGTIAIGCAAIDDVVAWTLLGTVAGIVQGAAGGSWLANHAVFLALLTGACVPRKFGWLKPLERLLHTLTTFVMPAFFIVVGLRTSIWGLAPGGDWFVVLVIIFTATIGKLGGGLAAARTLGFSWRDSFALGTLLNTRGLVALVALDVGRSLGLLSPRLFTMCVVMTLVTTLATVPILRLLGFVDEARTPAVDQARP